MLSSFTYNPTVTGSEIYSYIQSACKNLPPEQVGPKMWEKALDKIYTDFINNLQNDLQTYLNQAQVLFTPTISDLSFQPPSLSPFKSKLTSSGKTIDSNIKSKSSGKSASKDLGKIVWEEAFKQIYKDIVDTLPQPIIDSCNSATTTVKITAVAPGVSGITSPVPALLLSPFSKSSLENELKADFKDNNAKSLGEAYSSEIQSKFASFNTAEQHKMIGPMKWQMFVDKLKGKINDYIKKDIKNFFDKDPQHFAIPSGTPGNNPALIPPIIPSSAPQFGKIM